MLYVYYAESRNAMESLNKFEWHTIREVGWCDTPMGKTFIRWLQRERWSRQLQSVMRDCRGIFSFMLDRSKEKPKKKKRKSHILSHTSQQLCKMDAQWRCFEQSFGYLHECRSLELEGIWMLLLFSGQN